MSQLGILVTSACNIFKYCFLKDMMQTLKISEGSMENPRIVLVWEHMSIKKKKDNSNITMELYGCK